MSAAEWFSSGPNWVFLVLALAIVFAGFRVVTSRNIVHAALFLVGSLAATAALFLLLSAEFVAWVLVLVYIGAVIVLFLFGIMITRAPLGQETDLDHERRWPAALAALVLFAMMTYASIAAFGDQTLSGIGEPTSTETLGDALVGRFVLPFEFVGFVLLAALIGGIVLARKDTTPAEQESDI